MSAGTPRSRVYIHVTDPHLVADEAGRYNGVESLAGLRAVLEHVRSHLPEPDGFLVTGDLVHDESSQGYLHLVDAFVGWGSAVHVIPGNHDRPAIMRELLPRGNVRQDEYVAADDWAVLFLDSRVEGREDGAVAPGALSTLDEHLESSGCRHALVAMHHNLAAHPQRGVVSSVENAGEVMAWLSRRPQIRAVLSGHVHQEMCVLAGGVLYLSTPTPGYQSVSASGRPTGEAAGYRRIELFDDGTLLADTIRITSAP
jgi:Icc protein